MSSSFTGSSTGDGHGPDDDEITTRGHADSADAHVTPPVPSAAEIAAMNDEQAMMTGAAVDGVFIEHRRQRFPVPGTRTEKRAERAVAACFLISFLAGLGFVVAFIAVPFKYHLLGQGSQSFTYYTPILGTLLGLSLFALGIGAVLWAKWLMPEEEVVQDRHDGPSSITDQMLTAATLKTGLEDTGLARRSMIKMSLGLAGGALGLMPLVALVGGLIRKPRGELFHTMWKMNVPMVYADGRRVSTNDLEPGGIATVFPGVPGAIQLASSPTLLIRLRPGQVIRARKGQSSFGWNDYVAFSKICTHAGCPASLYEQQTTRLLCPCHQSQFEVLEDAKPVFGPATRSLPKLPIGVETGADGVTYFVAMADYDEAIGPAFWERP